MVTTILSEIQDPPHSKQIVMSLQDTTGDVKDSFFGFNQVTTNGGAIFRGTSTGTISGNTFLNNTANLDGGAIYESHVDVRLSLPISCT